MRLPPSSKKVPGTTIENQEQADKRIHYLQDFVTPAVRFLSYEPLLGPLDIRKYLSPAATACVRLVRPKPPPRGPPSLRGGFGLAALLPATLAGRSPLSINLAITLSQGLTMTTLGAWGRALALRLPSHIVQTGQLKPGMTCDCRLLDDGTIRVRLGGAVARDSAAASDPALAKAPGDNGDKTW